MKLFKRFLNIVVNYAKATPFRVYKYFFNRALYRAVKKANKERKLTKYKMMVMKVNGWPRVYRKADLKAATSRKALRLKKGKTFADLEKSALYITT